MAKFSDKARDFIKSQVVSNICDSGLLDITTASLYTLVSQNVAPEEKEQTLVALRQAIYINRIVLWKLSSFVWERRAIDADFKNFQDKISWANELILAYNDAVKSSVNFLLVNVVNAATRDIAPVTQFKSGKMHLQKRHIQREKVKLFNKNKARLYTHFVVARVVEDFIQSNDLMDFITDDVVSSIKELKSPSILEYEIKTDISSHMYDKCKYFIFNDLTIIEQWQQDLWGY